MAYVSWATKFGATTATSDVTVTGSDEVEISSDVTAREITVQAGGKIKFAPASTATLNAYGNVHLDGAGAELIMRPTAGQVHKILFPAVVEANFVGNTNPAGHAFAATDIGLWVMHGARLDIGDARDRLAWTNLTGSASAGATSINVVAATNWRVGDRIVITPTVSPADSASWWTAYDDRTITSITGTTIGLSAPLTYAHPSVSTSVTAPDGWTMPTTYTAEVLNLTRDVRIEGLPNARPHVLIHSTAAHYVKNVSTRYMGPQKFQGTSTTKKEIIPGRYGFHLHHAGTPVAPPTYENIVVAECGNRAFVPHASHNLTMLNCIAHDSQGEQFWWDMNVVGTDNESNNVVWDHCVASMLTVPPNFGLRSRFAQYQLGDGDGNQCIDCVAVGNSSDRESTGFHWAEGTAKVWTFERCISHNHERDGLFVWHNNKLLHFIDDFVAYYCARGIDHGAYSNVYEYRRALLIGCTESGVQIHASSFQTKRQGLRNFSIDGKGFGNHALSFLHPNISPSLETDMETWHVIDLAPANPANGDGFLVYVENGVGQNPNIAYLRDWICDDSVTMDTLVFWTGDFRELDVLKFRNPTVEGVDQGFFDVRHQDSEIGTAVTEWNGAKRQDLEADDFGSIVDGTFEIWRESFDVADSASAFPAGWTSNLSGTTIETTGGKGIVKVGAAGGSGGTLHLPAIAELDASTDHQIGALFTWEAIAGRVNLTLWLRATGAGPGTMTGYALTTSSNQVGINLYRYDSGVPTTLATGVIGSLPVVGEPMRAKLRIETIEGAATLKAKVWSTSFEESTIWGFTETLTDPITTGTPKISAVRSNNGPTWVSFSEVKVSDFVEPIPDVLVTLLPQTVTLTPAEIRHPRRALLLG